MTVTASGRVDLFVPPDLPDLVAPGSDDEARASFAAQMAQLLPRASRELQDALVDGLMAHRARLTQGGAVLHGVVAVPADLDDPDRQTPAHWQIFANVVELATAEEIDIGAVLRRYLRTELDESAYVESFETAMGSGVGVLTRMPLVIGQEARARHPEIPHEWGVAAAVSLSPDSPYGLLVVGLCLDLERHLAMAGIVAMIAAQSVVHTDPQTQEDESP